MLTIELVDDLDAIQDELTGLSSLTCALRSCDLPDNAGFALTVIANNLDDIAKRCEILAANIQREL